jgi:glycosyltransferase involved in cell wall biosynthesis
MKRTLIAVIAYNEQQNLAAALGDLRANGPEADIVVIDNGSTDRTKDIAVEAGVPVVGHCINSGGSMGTVTTYFRYAWRRRYFCLCQFDADGQHMASELSKIIGPILEDKADYVIGSRFLEHKGFQSHWHRRIGIRAFAQLDSLIMGQTVTDVTSGARAYGRRVIEFFGKHHLHELVDPNQLLLLSHFAGSRILEVPVLMRPRLRGSSEFGSITTALFFPMKGIVNIAGCLLQQRRIRQKWA